MNHSLGVPSPLGPVIENPMNDDNKSANNHNKNMTNTNNNKNNNTKRLPVSSASSTASSSSGSSIPSSPTHNFTSTRATHVPNPMINNPIVDPIESQNATTVSTHCKVEEMSIDSNNNRTPIPTSVPSSKSISQNVTPTPAFVTSSTNGPKIATSGGIRHNVVSFNAHSNPNVPTSSNQQLHIQQKQHQQQQQKQQKEEQHLHKSPRLSAQPVPQRYQQTTPSIVSLQSSNQDTSSIHSAKNSTNTKSNSTKSIDNATKTKKKGKTVTLMPTSTSNSNLTASSNSTDTTTTPTPDRRQKRLERNRESARLSRRRRKQYLEILEDRVTFLSQELDKSRTNHVLDSITHTKKLRMELISSLQQPQKQELMSKMTMLSNQLNRMSDELKLSITFGKEYVKSLITPASLKFILWLTLQNESFYRGGRTASERLSAARIGERMLNHGNHQASPCTGMWPLFCNEVGLSYDQEERVRVFQKEFISRNDTWLYRHVSFGSQHMIQSLHDSILGACETVKKREKSVMDILTDEQRAKFLTWKMAKMKKYDSVQGEGAAIIEKLSQALSKNLMLNGGNKNTDGDTSMDISYDSTMMKSTPVNCDSISSKNHDAANLYILNHKLSSTSKSSFPSVQVISTNPLVLKRLSRRPDFESLASVTESETKAGGGGSNKNGDKMTRATSTGSLKRCSSEMSCDENGMMMNMMKKSCSGHSLSSVAVATTPEAAQLTSSHAVSTALGPVRSLIPAMKITFPAAKLTPEEIKFRTSTATKGDAQVNMNLKQDGKLQPMYQPSSSIYSSSSTQYPNSIAVNMQTKQPRNRVRQFNAVDITPNSVQANRSGNHKQSTSSFTTGRAYSTVTNQYVQQQVQQPQSINYDTSVPLYSSSLSNNRQHSTSLPILNNRTSTVPSPLGFTDQYQQPTQLDMLLDESMSLYDVGDVAGPSYLYNVSSQDAENGLFDLTEEDWAIGEGAFLD